MNQRCTNSLEGFSVSYPSDWYTNEAGSSYDSPVDTCLEQGKMFYDLPTAIDSARVRAFCLRASPDEIAQRLRYRERGGLSERTSSAT